MHTTRSYFVQAVFEMAICTTVIIAAFLAYA